MFIWTLTNVCLISIAWPSRISDFVSSHLSQPTRDGSLENDIPIHEMMHGVSNRMTGGGTGRCLQTVESGGLGEGWSDAFAEFVKPALDNYDRLTTIHSWMQQKSATVTDFSMGTFVTNSQAGIRSAPYSINTQTNTLRYSSLQRLNEVHRAYP